MPESKTKIGLLGLGAIGTGIAYELQKNTANELFYFNRSSRNGLRLVIDGEKINVPVSVLTSIDSAVKLDFLVVCLKEHQFIVARPWFAKLVHSNTKVVVIRNGLQLKEPLLEFTSDDCILECMVDCPTQPIEDGYYEQIRRPQLTLPECNLANQFFALFYSKDITINLVEDFKTTCWEKLCESVSLGSILCLSGETCWIFEDKKIRDLYSNLLQESVAVARADGAQIKEDFIEKMLLKVLSYPKSKGSSMLTDRLNGNVIELGAKNGLVSRLGKQYEVNTTLNDFVTSVLGNTNRKR